MDYSEEEQNMRVLDKFTIQRTDPYGFWVILEADGSPSRLFPEVYTQVSLAKKAIEVYLSKPRVEVPRKRK